MGNDESLPSDGSDQIVVFDKGITKYEGQLKQNNAIKVLNLQRNMLVEFPRPLPALITAQFCANHLKKLTKSMISALLSYSNLETLDLANNELTDFPAALSDMKNLTSLLLLNNKIKSGNFNLPNLKRLDLGQNKITAIPPLSQNLEFLSLSFNFLDTLSLNLPKLTVLEVELSDLKNISTDICLPNLKVFKASQNKLKGLPNIAAVMPKLEELDVSYNFLTGMPAFPPSLLKLNISNNDISTLTLVYLLNVTELDLSHNKITTLDKIPKTITKLNASFNEIKEVTPVSLIALEELNISHNKLEEFPSIEAPKAILYTLDNNMISRIPEDLPQTVKKLSIKSNQLTALPDFLFSMKSLQILNVANNNITDLPAAFSQSFLKAINISLNPIKLLPDCKFPPKLEKFMAAYCCIDYLPDAFASAPPLEVFDISGNNLQAMPPIPSCKRFFASRNQFSALPPFPKECIILDLSFNAIPFITPCSLPDIQCIDFSYNKLTSLPKQWDAPKLSIIKLCHNPDLKEFSIEGLPSINHIEICDTGIVLKDSVKAHEVFANSNEQASQQSPKLIKPLGPLGYAETIGMRPQMEDSIIVRKLENGLTIVAVLDGHNGPNTATSVSRQMVRAFKIKKAAVSIDYLLDATSRIDQYIQEHPLGDGTTLAVGLIQGQKLIVEHLGDARLLLIRQNGRIHFSTIDHKPTQRDEFERIHEAGGRVKDGRVHGVIGVSRSIGDFCIPGIISTPEVSEIDLEEDDKWVIVCCDGVYDVLTNEYIGYISMHACDAAQLSYDIRNMAFAMGSRDNISVVVADLKSLQTQ